MHEPERFCLTFSQGLDVFQGNVMIYCDKLRRVAGRDR